MSKHKCGCGKTLKSAEGLAAHQRDMNHSDKTKPFRNVKKHTFDPENRPDWTTDCETCGQRPIHPLTGMCGPCSFGEADTVGGNW